MENHEELGEQLRRAADTGNLALVQQLLQQGVPVDATDSNGWTPLMRAAYHGHRGVCQLLLDHKASVDAKDKDGWTPLMYAASSGHTDVCQLLQLLLANKASVDAKDKDGMTPLMLAACWSNTDTCQLLLNNKASVDATDGYGQTPLMYAADQGHTNICHLLIDTIVTQIKKSKANAIVLLGTKKNRRPQYLNDRENNSRIDKPVIELIAREVHKLALWQQQSLFEQINAIENNKLKQELMTYAHEKLNAKSTSNLGNSDE